MGPWLLSPSLKEWLLPASRHQPPGALGAELSLPPCGADFSRSALGVPEPVFERSTKSMRYPDQSGLSDTGGENLISEPGAGSPGHPYLTQGTPWLATLPLWASVSWSGPRASPSQLGLGLLRGSESLTFLKAGLGGRGRKTKIIERKEEEEKEQEEKAVWWGGEERALRKRR